MLCASLFVHLLAAALLAWGANWLGLVRWRRARDAHWTERARLLWPARATAIGNLFLIPVLADRLHAHFLAAIPRWWIADGLASCVGAYIGTFPFDREVFPSLNFRAWLRLAGVSGLFRYAIWILLIVACVLMPEDFGWRGVEVAGGYIAVHLALQCGLFITILRWTNCLKTPPDRLVAIVAETSIRSGVIPHAIYEMSGPQALAFALPVTRDLVFSARLLEIATDEEIGAVVAHELAHLGESKWVVAGRLVGSLMLLPVIFMAPLTHWLGIYGPFVVFVCMLVLIQFGKALSRRMERRADNAAVRAQLNDGVYARALEKLYRENQIPAVNVNKRQTHPHLYDRMIAAGINPDYPRPRSPSRMTLIGFVYIVALAVLLALTIVREL